MKIIIDEEKEKKEITSLDDGIYLIYDNIERKEILLLNNAKQCIYIYNNSNLPLYREVEIVLGYLNHKNGVSWKIIRKIEESIKIVS